MMVHEVKFVSKVYGLDIILNIVIYILCLAYILLRLKLNIGLKRILVLFTVHQMILLSIDGLGNLIQVINGQPSLISCMMSVIPFPQSALSFGTALAAISILR